MDVALRWLGKLPAPQILVSIAGVVLVLAAFFMFAPKVFWGVDPAMEEDALSDLSPAKNAAYLAENAKKPGVTTTASGLQYKVLAPGNGRKPSRTSTVTVHYAGKLINGHEFDSSEGGAPISFPLNRVIAGWTEGLQLMQEGETAELCIPENLGYGAAGAGADIPPYQTLIFKVQLIKVN